MNILVVDDDVELCALLSRYLEKNGMRVFSAADALQAQDVLEREKVNLVIADYRMPHMNGIQLTQMLKSDPRHAAIPVILMSADMTDAISEEALRKGVAMVLQKPLSFDSLLTLVRFAQ
ncbi:MAG: response regulator [Myxococcaceae bacterium]